MVTECAVCYVSDINFLLPTLVSATSLRKYVPPHKADVYVLIVDDSVKNIEDLNRFLASRAINILPFTSSVIDKYRHNDWNTKHNDVPISALGRLFIPNVLPKGHKRILYLDGDTFIAADPSPLIDYSVPEGRFAAVDDIIYFHRNDFTKLGKFTREYLRGIGVNGNNGYFNSGMFIVGIDTWRSLAQEALLFFENNTKACLYHDQSALNAVVGNRRIRLSLAWNFQTPYRYWNIEKEIVPRIYHFTQFPKPWMGPVIPWADMYPIYESEAQNLAPLNLPRVLLSDDKINSANQGATWIQRSKFKYVHPLHLWLRRQAARKICQTSCHIDW